MDGSKTLDRKWLAIDRVKIELEAAHLIIDADARDDGEVEGYCREDAFASVVESRRRAKIETKRSYLSRRGPERRPTPSPEIQDSSSRS